LIKIKLQKYNEKIKGFAEWGVSKASHLAELMTYDYMKETQKKQEIPGLSKAPFCQMGELKLSNGE